MEKTFTKIFMDEKLPFLELRYSNSNAHFKKHFHDTFSLGVNKRGISIYTNKNKKYTLAKNMLSIINPNIVHSCNSCSDVLNIFYMMYLDKTWCRNVQNLINSDIKEFVNIPKDILENKKIYLEYIELCEYLFSDISINEKEDELLKFFLKFFALYLEKNRSKVLDSKYTKIASYLTINYKENISLHELAKTFDLNTFYIIRLFKEEANLTPHSYLLNIKINKAKQFLQEGKTIVDTALECGFYDQSHFHKNFVKIVATTPKEYQVNFVQDTGL